MAQVRLANEYAGLYRRSLGILPAVSLSPADRERLAEIEEESSDAFLMSLRGVVQSAIVRDAQEALEAARARARAQSKSSLLVRLGFITGASSSSSEESDDVLIAGFPVRLSNAQRRELEAVVKASGGEEEELEPVSPLCVTHSLGLDLKSATLELLSDPVASASTHERCRHLISVMVLDGAHAVALIRKSNFVLHASLNDLSVIDPTLIVDDEDRKVMWVESGKPERMGQQRFLDIQFEQGPIGSTADYFIRMTLLSAVFSYRQGWVKNVLMWSDAMSHIAQAESIGMDHARAAVARTVERATKSSEELLARAMLSHKEIDLHISAAAPIIRIPSLSKDLNQPISLVMIRLGAFSIHSKGSFDGYDSFSATSEGVQFLAGPNNGSWVNEQVPSEQFRILGPLTLRMDLLLSIVKDSPSVALCKIRCNMPSFRISVFEEHIEHIANILEAVSHSMRSSDQASAPVSSSAIHTGRKQCVESSRKAQSSDSYESNLEGSKLVDLKRQKAQMFNLLSSLPTSLEKKTNSGMQQQVIKYSLQTLVDFEFTMLSFETILKKPDGSSGPFQLEIEMFVVCVKICRSAVSIKITLRELNINHVLNCSNQTLVQPLLRIKAEGGSDDCPETFDALRVDISIQDQKSPNYSGSDMLVNFFSDCLVLSINPTMVSEISSWLDSNSAICFLKSTSRLDTESATVVEHAFSQNQITVNSMCMIYALSFRKLKLVLAQLVDGSMDEIALVEITTCNTNCIQSTSELHIELNVKTLFVTDCSAVREKRFFQNILAPCDSGNEFLRIQYVSIGPGHKAWSSSQKERNQSVDLEANGVRLNLDPVFMMKIHRYLCMFRLPLPVSLPQEQGSSSLQDDLTEQSRSEITYCCKFDCALKGLEFLFPESSVSGNGLLVRLEKMLIGTHPATKSCVGVEEMSTNLTVNCHVVKSDQNLECANFMGEILVGKYLNSSRRLASTPDSQKDQEIANISVQAAFDKLCFEFGQDELVMLISISQFYAEALKNYCFERSESGNRFGHPDSDQRCGDLGDKKQSWQHETNKGQDENEALSSKITISVLEFYMILKDDTVTIGENETQTDFNKKTTDQRSEHGNSVIFKIKNMALDYLQKSKLGISVIFSISEFDLQFSSIESKYFFPYVLVCYLS